MTRGRIICSFVQIRIVLKRVHPFHPPSYFILSLREAYPLQFGVIQVPDLPTQLEKHRQLVSLLPLVLKDPNRDPDQMRKQIEGEEGNGELPTSLTGLMSKQDYL